MFVSGFTVAGRLSSTDTCPVHLSSHFAALTTLGPWCKANWTLTYWLLFTGQWWLYLDWRIWVIYSHCYELHVPMLTMVIRWHWFTTDFIHHHDDIDSPRISFTTTEYNLTNIGQFTGIVHSGCIQLCESWIEKTKTKRIRQTFHKQVHVRSWWTDLNSWLWFCAFLN